MSNDEDLGRFELWLVQIERFAATDNFLDAIARARALVREASAALAGRPGDLALEALVARARARLEALEQRFEAQNRAVRERRLAELKRISEGR